MVAIGHGGERNRIDDRGMKSPPRGDGHTAIPSLSFSSQDLGHAHTCVWCEFKPLGPGIELGRLHGSPAT